MTLKDKKIGFAFTGSFCMFNTVIEQLKELTKTGAQILPIMSFNSYSINSKFGEANEFIKKVEELTNNKIISTIEGAEPIGPKNLTDIMLVAPCSGNTLAKLANAINDTPVTMAIKSHLRNQKPVILAISTNDGLSASAENIGKLLNKTNYFFVPFRQDNPITKPRSLVFAPEYIIKTLEATLKNEQIQPILL